MVHEFGHWASSITDMDRGRVATRENGEGEVRGRKSKASILLGNTNVTGFTSQIDNEQK